MANESVCARNRIGVYVLSAGLSIKRRDILDSAHFLNALTITESSDYIYLSSQIMLILE